MASIVVLVEAVEAMVAVVLVVIKIVVDSRYDGAWYGSRGVQW